MKESKNNLVLFVPGRHNNREATIEIDGAVLGTARVGRKGEIIISKRSPPGRQLLDSIQSGADIVIVL